VAEFRLAFWGHGRNFQSDSTTTFAERAKRLLSREADWWFAYTQRSAEIVASLPFNRNRITVVNNAIDTGELAKARNTIRRHPGGIEELRQTLGLSGDQVGLFVGAMYAEKRLPFLIECCDRIRSLVPEFEMVFVGAGTAEDLVRQASRERPWMHYVGPVFGPAVARYFALASVVLMPGLVGLGVLDSFVCETPMVTTGLSTHSPEIEYLESGINGIVVRPPDDVESFSNAVSGLLCDRTKLITLIDGCRASARLYSIEGMAGNFAAGVLEALHAPKAAGRKTLHPAKV